MSLAARSLAKSHEPTSAVVQKRGCEGVFLRLAPALLLLLPNASLAETYLCAADAGAIVEDGGGKPAASGVADVSTSRFVLTEANGKWGVKLIGQDDFLFDQCIISNEGKPSLCEMSGGMFAGTFFMGGQGRFSILWMTHGNGRDQWIVAKGRCSAI